MIHVDAKKSKRANRFSVVCNVSDNHLVIPMPNRRFNKRLKNWAAPAVARNVDYILRLEERNQAVLTDEARQLCQNSLDMRIKRSTEHFPAWYPFKTTPRPVQLKGLNAIWGIPNPALFCEMGTGKSKMVIDWFSAKVMSQGIRSLVIFCPVAIRDNWVEEIGAHCPLADLEVGVVETKDTRAYREVQRFVAKESEGPKILICGIESLQQGFAKGKAYELLLDFVSDERNQGYLTAIDESHYIQNHTTNRWENVHHLSIAAKAKLIATGTETDGNPLDLFGQFEYLDTEILGFGDYYSYKNRYTIRGGFENKQTIGFQNMDELMELISPHVFQATLAEVADIPEKIYMAPRYVSLTKEQDRVIREIQKEGETTLSGEGADIEVVTEGVLAVYTAVQQVCCGHVGYAEHYHSLDGEEILKRRVKARVVAPDKNPKIQELMSVVQEVRGKTLIWCKYRMEIEDVADALRRRYGHDAVVEYHGGMTREERKLAVTDFKTRDSAKFKVLMTSVGGTGLTFNEAVYSIYMSNSFKLRDRLQSEARNHRIGQNEHVTYIDIVAKTKVERTIMRALRDKKDVADYIRDRLRSGAKVDEFL